MRFEPNPNFEREMSVQILRNLERLRPTVQSVECPDHPGQHPDLIRQENELRIAACCKVAATLASTKAGFGDVRWKEGPEAGQEVVERG
ncbi:MAG: hypothetical protein ACRDG9_08870 [Actinomycetota bacterium]